MTDAPHICGPGCVLPCPNAQVALRFDLTDVHDTIDEDVPCDACDGEGWLSFDHHDAHGEHWTIETPCPECCVDDDAAIETASEVREDLSACR